MRNTRLGLSFAVLGLTFPGGCAAPRPVVDTVVRSQKIPVRRAETELLKSLEWQKTFRKLSKETFLEGAKPYSFAALNILKPSGYRDSDSLANFYLGSTGQLAGLSESEIPELTNRFQCGAACARQRQKLLKKNLSAAKKLVELFEGEPGARLVSVWGQGQEYRVNEFFNFESQAIEQLPSPKFGLVPSGNTKLWSSADEYLKDNSIRPDRLVQIREKLRELGLHAIVKDEWGTRTVTAESLGDNQAGLIFSTVDPSPYRKSDDGLKIVVLKLIEPGVYFYQTR